MIRPVVNSVGRGDLPGFWRGIAATAAIYAVGALSALGYTQTMVRAAQKVLYDIRRDLFAISRPCRCAFFDTQRHGDIMSYFTNDVDTVADALNNSFAMTIQSFIQMTGTLAMLFVLNWQLSLVVVLGLCGDVPLYPVQRRRSTRFYTAQQAALGDVDGYIEEMVGGQKVIKVFNHEAANLRAFDEKNETLRKAGTGARTTPPPWCPPSSASRTSTMRLWRCWAGSWRSTA